jgi:hypothetical protein
MTGKNRILPSMLALTFVGVARKRTFSSHKEDERAFAELFKNTKFFGYSMIILYEWISRYTPLCVPSSHSGRFRNVDRSKMQAALQPWTMVIDNRLWILYGNSSNRIQTLVCDEETLDDTIADRSSCNASMLLCIASYWPRGQWKWGLVLLSFDVSG